MRPETTITLNKPSFRADEPITGFVDIDINQSVPGEWDPKLWVVKVRLVGYAQMDTQWHDQARNSSNWQEKTRYETLPIEDCEMTVRSTDVPMYLKPGVAHRIRSLPFQLQLSPSQLIASYNSKTGLFLVDYLLTATTRRKCPTTGWNLLKLETRTFVTITPPEGGVERPLQVTPYSPPLDDMDLFRCPFMQTIRFNYSNHLTPSSISPSHRMSIYFPRPLYEPEDVVLSLTSTLTLQYNHVVNRSTETTGIPFETYYRPDTGGEEITVEFDIPIKTPQTMEFKFPKGTMTMTHALRVTMRTKLFPGDKSKCSNKTWSVDLPITIKGQHYTDPLSPVLSTLTTISSQRSPTSPATARSLSHKTSDTSQASKFASTAEESDGEGTMPLSAASATSSFATTTGYSSAAETASESGSPRSITVSPPAKRRKQRTVPPQKPAPTGPLPAPPQSATPSPIPLYRISPERQTRSTTGERKHVDNPVELQQLYPKKSSRDLNNHNRSTSVPPPKSLQPEATYNNYDPFLPPRSTKGREPLHSPEPPSAGSISSKSTYPLSPTELPSYYHSKPSYYIDSSPKQRPRANTTGSPSITSTSPVILVASPPGSPQMARVKFNPEISTSPSPPSVYSQPQSPPLSPRSPPSTNMDAYPFPRMDTMRKGPASSGHGVTLSSPPISPPASMVGISRKRVSPTETVRSDETVKPPSQYSRNVISPPPIKLIPPSQLSQPKSAARSNTNSSPTFPTLNSKLSISALAPSSPPSTTSTRRSPPLSINPSARPPLTSASKTRITSMATTDTNITINTSTTRGTMSTTATSITAGSAAGPKVQLKRRPTKPSLFPPLPPATMAVTRQRLEVNVGDRVNDGRSWI